MNFFNNRSFLFVFFGIAPQSGCRFFYFFGFWFPVDKNIECKLKFVFTMCFINTFTKVNEYQKKVYTHSTLTYIAASTITFFLHRPGLLSP